MSLVWVPTRYSQHRAETGRLSSGLDPNDPDKGIGRKKVQQLHNVPRALRDMYVAPPGKVLVGADSSAVEWVVFMHLGAEINDPPGYHRGLLDRFALPPQDPEHLDPHRYLAQVWHGVPSQSTVTREDRQTCKPYTYGLLFMGSPRGVADSVGHRWDVGERIAEAHARAFKTKPVWDAIIDEAKRTKQIRTLGGWVRYFWDWNPKPTEVIATKIQGSAADLHKYILIRIAREKPPTWDILTFTHDNDVLMVPEEDEQEARRRLAEWTQMPIPFFGGRGFPAEVKSGKNWRQVS